MSTNENPQLEKMCFVAMPITTPIEYVEKLGDSEHFIHVLTHLFVPALEEAGLKPISPLTSGAELIHAEIIRNLEQADFVLCDLSGLNPNVLFELGIRTSLNSPVILVKDNLTERTPFDLNAINMLTYDSSLTPWSLVSEKPRLVEHILHVMNSGNIGNSMWRYFGLTKRATPSEAGENPLEAKLDLLISEVSTFQSSIRTIDRRPEQAPISRNIDSFVLNLRKFLVENEIDRYQLTEGNNGIFHLDFEPDAYDKLSEQRIFSTIHGIAGAKGIDIKLGVMRPKSRGGTGLSTLLMPELQRIAQTLVRQSPIAS